jgi:hypothetical protein
MLPTTFFWLSRTGSDVTASLYIISKAVARGLSPLFRSGTANTWIKTHLMAKTE